LSSLRFALISVLLVACKGEAEDPDRPAPRKSSSSKPAAAVESATASATPAAEPSGPRYLRATSKGTYVDAFKFPSVPASIVEQEVGSASTRKDAAGVLRRFGLAPLEGTTGAIWIAPASLVDRQARERLLVATFRGDESAGLRDEDDWIVFLGTTEEDRLIKVDSVRVKAKTAAPIEVDARELHSADFDDVVATWSSCSGAVQKACHWLRAWTMQRGRPELILDVSGDSEPVIAGHSVVVDGRTLAFDPQTFAYH
jgi:hypothetical protein